MKYLELLSAPCVFCGYNGKNYWQTDSHEKNCPVGHIGGFYEREQQLREVISNIYKKQKK